MCNLKSNGQVTLTCDLPDDHDGEDHVFYVSVQTGGRVRVEWHFEDDIVIDDSEEVSPT